MKTGDVAKIMDDVLRVTEEHCKDGRRDQILNERFFHHMFSYFAARRIWQPPKASWKTLTLIPEKPTEKQFRLAELNLKKPRHTANKAIGKGQRGNLDFQIKDPDGAPTICVEWKGPRVYSTREMAWVLLKLLTQPKSQVKVVAALITSAEQNRADHILALRDHFNEALKFVRKVLGDGHSPLSLGDAKLYGYIATIPNNGAKGTAWGRVTGPLQEDSGKEFKG